MPHDPEVLRQFEQYLKDLGLHTPEDFVRQQQRPDIPQGYVFDRHNNCVIAGYNYLVLESTIGNKTYIHEGDEQDPRSISTPF